MLRPAASLRPAAKLRLVLGVGTANAPLLSKKLPATTYQLSFLDQRLAGNWACAALNCEEIAHAFVESEESYTQSMDF